MSLHEWLDKRDKKQRKREFEQSISMYTDYKGELTLDKVITIIKNNLKLKT